MAEKSGSSPSNKQWISLALMISTVPHAACHSERTAQRSSLRTSLEAPADYDRNISSRSIPPVPPDPSAGNEPANHVCYRSLVCVQPSLPQPPRELRSCIAAGVRGP